MTLNDIIEGRSKLPPEDEIEAWMSDRARAESTYLHMLRLCNERIDAALKRMRTPTPPTDKA